MGCILKTKRPSAGFTLVELMIVVVIVAILASIAMPLYTDYIRRGRIPEATATLAANRVKMEQWFQDAKTYVDGAGCHVPDSSGKYFDFTCTNASAAGYLLTATGKGAMLGFTYTVDQADAKTSKIEGISGWSGSTSCWVTSSGGVC